MKLPEQESKFSEHRARTRSHPRTHPSFQGRPFWNRRRSGGRKEGRRAGELFFLLSGTCVRAGGSVGVTSAHPPRATTNARPRTRFLTFLPSLSSRVRVMRTFSKSGLAFFFFTRDCGRILLDGNGSLDCLFVIGCFHASSFFPSVTAFYSRMSHKRDDKSTLLCNEGMHQNFYDNVSNIGGRIFT